MLGFFRAQIELKTPAIGGKDSASGTYKKEHGTLMHVPTTLFSIANSPEDSGRIVSAEFQKSNSRVLYFRFPKDMHGLPDWVSYRRVLRDVR